MVHSSRFGSGRRAKRTKPDINPMEGVANLADIMLVFACGLMVSVIMFWQVNLNDVVSIVDQKDLVEANDLEEAAKDGSLSNKYQSKGVVYEDPETGKMYIVMP